MICVAIIGCWPGPPLGRKKSFEQENYPPPSHWDRRVILPNRINLGLSSALAPMWTPPINQGCESRRQKNLTCSWPSFREIWKVSSLLLSGKIGSLRASPRSSFPRPPYAENEPSIAVRGSRLPPLTPLCIYLPFSRPPSEHWKMKNLMWKKIAVLTIQKYKNVYNKKS